MLIKLSMLKEEYYVLFDKEGHTALTTKEHKDKMMK